MVELVVDVDSGGGATGETQSRCKRARYSLFNRPLSERASANEGRNRW